MDLKLEGYSLAEDSTVSRKKKLGTLKPKKKFTTKIDAHAIFVSVDELHFIYSTNLPSAIMNVTSNFLYLVFIQRKKVVQTRNQLNGFG